VRSISISTRKTRRHCGILIAITELLNSKIISSEKFVLFVNKRLSYLWGTARQRHITLAVTCSWINEIFA